MKLHYVIPAVCLVLLAAPKVPWADLSKLIPRGGTGDTEVAYPVISPTADLQQAVQPIRDALRGEQAPQDARRLTAFYGAFANVVGRDLNLITGTEQVRACNSTAGALLFQSTGIKGKYPGLAAAIDGFLADQVGLENVTLSDEKRRKAVAALQAVQWACAQVGGSGGGDTPDKTDKKWWE